MLTVLVMDDVLTLAVVDVAVATAAAAAAAAVVVLVFSVLTGGLNASAFFSLTLAADTR